MAIWEAWENREEGGMPPTPGALKAPHAATTELKYDPFLSKMDYLLPIFPNLPTLPFIGLPELDLQKFTFGWESATYALLTLLLYFLMCSCTFPYAKT